MLAQIERRTRELEEMSRAKDEFLATLSHELRTPLNAILGWSSMLRQPGFDKRRIGYGLEVIERNAQMQQRLVLDLLDVSRVIAGKLKIESQRIHLGPVIRRAMDVVKPAADAKQLRLESAVGDSDADLILGDAERLQQVVWNLLSNAVKFTAPGGTVRVSVRRARDWVEVEVEDSGEGIDAAFLPRAFDPFSQGDRSPTSVHGGLGLGLSIVRRLVELHGGTVELASPGKGHGTRVVIRLPPLAPASARIPSVSQQA
jgi:signal transduction histidine kinase